MIATLYGETNSTKRADRSSRTAANAEAAKETFIANVKNRREFSVSFG